ncbi:MAG: TIGR03960 family B12-binding radical SAM protein [Candidatus Zixiibacteriota bacterium]|nr:MAG: TIGR03960 family B12-binding radical SAM protein [candidate division Zixibacteria bacterium]
MKDLLEERFFPRVIKPGRYTGGEPGQILKSPDNRVKYLHSYPDKYEIGMSYVGLQTLYHVVNSDDRFLCERVFAVDHDAEELLRSEQIPLFSLESGRPAAEFDAFGFTLVDETVCTNVLAMLDLAGIPLRSADRTEDHPIVMAGGPAAYNPEPMAPFFDLFFIGDAEQGLPEMLAVLYELSDAGRREKLEALVRRVKSVYVPTFYDDNLKPLVDFAPEQIDARVEKELKPEYYPSKPLLPLIETVHDHLAVEIMRGCPQGCRFCMAGAVYRPVRLRPREDIVAQVKEQVANTGFAEVTLLSLSSSDYPEVEPLATELARLLEPRRISLSLPSLRPGTVSPSLLEALSRVRRGGFTIAPEAGTERLRSFLRKDFTDEAIYDSARLAMKKGWTTIKLYFMIGLPTETEEDLDGIVNIVRNLHRVSREFEQKVNINVTLSPFSPKPHTPLQWDEILPEDQIFQKISYIRRRTRLSHVHFKHTDTRLATLISMLGRGDRSLADVIEAAFRQGCRFDGWSEDFDHERWDEAFASTDTDPQKWLEPIPFSARLPWSHIRKGPSVDRLRAERERTSVSLKSTILHPSEIEKETQPESNRVQFGRGKKKIVSRNQASPAKNRFRFRWGRTARCRYMSHLDNLRAMERALRRANLPVAYSHGFNPTMKLSFGPPLPLGFTSEAEFVDINFESNLTAQMVDQFKSSVPSGILILEARSVHGKSVSLSAALNRVAYTLALDEYPEAADLQPAIDELWSAETKLIDRKTKKGMKQVDIRPAIYNVSLEEDSVQMLLGIGEKGYARPSEVMHCLTGRPQDEFDSLPFHRREMFRIELDGRRVDPMEI